MGNEPVLISTWNELRECESETHVLEIKEDGHSGWIYPKGGGKFQHYLSTHTFYESTYSHSTRILQECGFNVQLVSWG